jgi:hypothetical protein
LDRRSFVDIGGFGSMVKSDEPFLDESWAILSGGRLLYPPFEAKTPLKCHG